MLRLARYVAFFLPLFLALCMSREARADAAAAQALFDQGKKLMGEKKYAEACAKFEESQKLDPGLGTQTNLAICYESLGRTASAWSLYLEVASQAKATNQLDREKKARDAAKALEPKLSKLTIEVAAPPPGLEVKRNGQDVGQASWGTPLPVDPGEIKITAVAPGKKQWETSIKIDKPGDTTVKVPELEQGEAPPPGFGTAPAGTGTAPGFGYPPPPMPPRMKRRSGGLFGGGIAMVCVGGLLTLGGAVAVAITADYDVGPSAGVLLGGLALVGGGTAMIVIGGKKVPVTDASTDEPVPVASPVPEVRVGAGSLAAKWVF